MAQGDVISQLAETGLIPFDGTAQFGPQYSVAEGPEGAVVGVASYGPMERASCYVLLWSNKRIVQRILALNSRQIGCPTPSSTADLLPTC